MGRPSLIPAAAMPLRRAGVVDPPTRIRSIDHATVPKISKAPDKSCGLLTKLELYREALQCGGIKRYIIAPQPFRIA
jgi:hypothetical protein